MVADPIEKVKAGGGFSRDEAEAVMEELLQGRMAQADVVSLLAALRDKGETVEELVGFARAMRRHVHRVVVPRVLSPAQKESVGIQANATGVSIRAVGVTWRNSGVTPGLTAPEIEEYPLVDTCGTGGGRAGTFNVSTAAALVVAGAGVRVAKHGNRSFSSASGSADVLEALGLNLQAPPERAGEAIARIGIAFLFAPAMHTAMKHAMPARRELGGRTVFNLLGPLTNPAGATVQVIGVPEAALVDKVGQALAELGVARGFVVHGLDGLDEISLSEETEVADVRAHSVNRYRVAPEDFGVSRAARDLLAGGDAATNARVIRAVLRGERGPQRDFVCINAGAALVAAGRVANFRDGANLAAAAIDSGAALAKLEALVAFSHEIP